MSEAYVRIDKIVIGQRFRKEMGDIGALAESIKAVGLIQSVVVSEEDMKLIDGERRIRACKKLGWTKIPARLVNISKRIMAERDANDGKHFTMSERVAIGRAIEAELGHRQGKRKEEPLRANLPEVKKGQRNRDVAAKKADLSPRSYEKAKAVVEAAEANPEAFEEVQKEMDRTGKVDPAYKKVRAKTDPKPTPAETLAADVADTVRLFETAKDRAEALKQHLNAKRMDSVIRRCVESIAFINVAHREAGKQ